MKAEHTAGIEALLAHAGWLRRFAFALVKDADEAEDLAQDTMVAAWRHPIEPVERAWLSRVARNLAINRFRGTRRRERREQEAESLAPGRDATAEELIGEAQVHRLVAEVVTGLPEPYRQTIVLRFYEGRSCADIARGLGVPDGTIRWRLKEGLDRVRRKLDARHGNDRSAWVALLVPLVPRTWSGERASPAHTGSASWKYFSATHLALAVLGASVLSLAILGLVSWAGRPHPTTVEQSQSATAPAMPVASGRSIRLNLASQAMPASGEGEAPAATPGRADTQSLAEELLQAVRGNDYDAFVAKGSAFFRAALPPRGFAAFSAGFGERLAKGYRVSTLGSVRRSETIDWQFKIEFFDGDDDAMVTLAMDGWQVAGFLIDDPNTLLPEK